ncbi:MAG: DUF1275 domain-containing protein [Roseburia sp.]|nr:DUF1275 domain-containing protein [Roseburia sp.]
MENEIYDSVTKSQETYKKIRNLLLFLSVSAGMAEYYSFFFRGGIFAVLQPGNIVQIVLCAVNGRKAEIPAFLWPILAFAAGALAAELIRRVYQQFEGMRWQQTAVLIGAMDIFAVGLLAGEAGKLSDILLAFTWGVLAEVGRRLSVGGEGRVRLAITAAVAFLVGVLFGHSMINMFGERGIWCCCLFLIVIYYMMAEKKRAFSPPEKGEDLHK